MKVFFTFLAKVLSALATFIGLLMLLAIAGVVFLNLKPDRINTVREKQALTVPGQTDQDSIKIWINDAGNVKGRNILRLAVNTERKFGYGSGSDYGYDGNGSLNYAFSDLDTGETVWVFDHTNYLITQINELNNCVVCDKETQKTLAYLFSVIKADSDGDKKLTRKDNSTLFLVGPDGLNVTEIKGESGTALIIDHVISFRTLSSEKAIVFYKSGNNIFSQTFTFPVYRQLNLQKVKMWAE